jgi:hypothetical protein
LQPEHLTHAQDGNAINCHIQCICHVALGPHHAELCQGGIPSLLKAVHLYLYILAAATAGNIKEQQEAAGKSSSGSTARFEDNARPKQPLA